MSNLLYSLNLPEDLKNLTKAEYEQLAEEIREELIKIGDQCGGHLASNLGVVELTLALHAVFDSPTDKTVWDTSHQCYVHKMLTGRLRDMYTIRQNNGLSGFAKIAESEHDHFGAGHASTSLSAALGMAQGRDVKKESYSVVSVVGDSSLSGGMAFEALNNIKYLPSNFICILNDNDMAISQPVGNMADMMTRMRTSPVYRGLKERFGKAFDRVPKIGTPLKRKIEQTVERMRSIVLDFKVGVIFEEFGFKYLGPIDGHNISMVMGALKFAKNYDAPILIHIITKKGKGHEPAEENPIKYHGVSPKPAQAPVSAEADARPSENLSSQVAANIPAENGQSKRSLEMTQAQPAAEPKFVSKSYSQVLGDTVTELAAEDDSIVVVTPAMKEGSGLTGYADAFPERFFDVGIAEEHAVTFCAGMALQGVKPILSIYSTFLQRGFDQVIHDVCLQKIPMVFTLDRAGLVGEDGPTHHGVFDLAFLLMIPDLILLAPKDGDDLAAMVKWAVKQPLPTFVRFPKGKTSPRPIQLPVTESNHIDVLYSPDEGPIDVLVLGAGSMAWPAYEAANMCSERGLQVTAIDLKIIKPLDVAGLAPYISRAKQVLVVEEGCEIGGVFTYVRQQVESHFKKQSIDLNCKWEQIGIPDTFVSHGKLPWLRKNLGLDTEGIVEKVKAMTHEHVLDTMPA